MSYLAWVYLRLASLLLPAPARAAWIESWDAELRHRLRGGLSPGETRRAATGIWRDAKFQRQRASRATESPWSRALIPELSFFLAATTLWFAFLPAAHPPACGSHLQRAVFVQRSYATMGVALSTVTARLRRLLREADLVEDVASFRIRPGDVTHVLVSRNFFEMLGVAPLQGTSLQNASVDAAVLTDSLWRSHFGADPHIAGKPVLLENRKYTVAGVLPPDFLFASRRIQYFAPLPEDSRATGLLVLLKPGISLGEAQQTVRGIAQQAGEGWRTEAYRLVPYLHTPSWQDPFLPAMAVALASLILAALLAAFRSKLGGLVFYGSLAARFLLSVTAVSEIATLLARIATERLVPSAIAHLWFFTMSCCVIFILTVKDHLARCPVCLKRLEMPTSFGMWGRLLSETPATEFACPNGHGMLYQTETGDTRARWTPLDPSWRDLFLKK